MLDVLISLQKARDLNDGPFAASLGVSREHWNKIRHERNPLTRRIVLRALKTYPEIGEDADIFLRDDDRKLSLVMEKEPSNIDAEASEATRTLVLTGDRQTLACRGAGAASVGQDQGGRMPDRTNVLKAAPCYVVARPSASERSSRAVSRVGEAG